MANDQTSAGRNIAFEAAGGFVIGFIATAVVGVVYQIGKG